MKDSSPPSKQKQLRDVEFTKEKNGILREAFQRMYTQQGAEPKEMKRNEKVK